MLGERQVAAPLMAQRAAQGALRLAHRRFQPGAGVGIQLAGLRLSGKPQRPSQFQFRQETLVLAFTLVAPAASRPGQHCAVRRQRGRQVAPCGHASTVGQRFLWLVLRDDPEERRRQGGGVRCADAPYRAGRSRDWLKFKCESGQEFVIGGFTDPRGTRTGFGALLLGYYDPGHALVYAGKVGTGFNRQTLTSLHGTLASLEQDRPPFDRGRLPRSGVHWVQPRLVAQVGFSEWTTSGELRHPRFQGLRDDKDPAEVIRELPQESGQ